MKKRIISSALALAFLAALAVQALATSFSSPARINAGCIDSGPLPSIAEQLAELGDARNYTPEQAAMAEKLHSAEALINADASADTERPITRATTWSSLPGTYLCYAQETYYYCMPASAKAVIQYLTGSSDSQTTIAAALGVVPINGGDFANMKPYLNSKQNKNSYIFMNSSITRSVMEQCLRSAIAVHSVPPVLRICAYPQNGDDWPYETGGHAIPLNASKDDYSQFQAADPAMQYIWPTSNPFLQRDTSLFYKMITYYNAYGGFLY